MFAAEKVGGSAREGGDDSAAAGGAGAGAGWWGVGSFARALMELIRAVNHV